MSHVGWRGGEERRIVMTLNISIPCGHGSRLLTGLAATGRDEIGKDERFCWLSVLL